VLPAQNYTFNIISLGCSKNFVDSENLNKDLQKAGLKPAFSSEEADFILINTCGFIKEAKKEAINTIFSALEYKSTSKIIVLGCLSQRYYEELKKEIPEIDFLYKLFDSNFIDNFCSFFKIKKSTPPFPQIKFLNPQSLFSYLKISEGCSNRCHFCAIPQIRGPHRAFPLKDLILKTKQSAKKKAAELIIIGQDISAYQWKNYDLVDLVEQISLEEGIEWIRLLYCHPDHLTKRIIKLIQTNKKIVKYLDLPFQHASSKILKAMGRKGDFKTYYKLLSDLRDLVPEIKIRSTFLLGYPGETDKDFAELIKFLGKAKIDKVGCFIFSPEENTPAYSLKPKIPAKIKKERYKIFMEKQREISLQKLQKMINSKVKVIVEEKIDKETYIGRSEFDAPEVDGLFYLTSKSPITCPIVTAKITDAIEYDLIGEKVEDS